MNSSAQSSEKPELKPENKQTPEPNPELSVHNASHPHHSKILIFGLVIIFLFLGVLLGYYYAMNRNQSISEPKTISLSPIPTTLASPTPSDPTANWKTYTSDSMNVSFNYPSSWFVQESEDHRDIMVSSFNPKLPGNDAFRPGDYAVEFRNFEQKANTIQQLKEELVILDKKAAPAFGERLIQNEKEIEINNKTALSREFAYKDSNLFTLEVYVLNGKGDIKIISHRVSKDGEQIYNQILSTFKFTQ